MFGSLVVIFPTPHEGGNFILSSGDEKWSFDGHKMLSSSTPDVPEVAYIAFYSDTKHEVLPVTSGCRITLTYNLYFETAANLPVASTSDKYEVVHNALKEVVNDRKAFPADGMLCFGLAHQYTIGRTDRREQPRYGQKTRNDDGLGTAYRLAELAGFLKGSDALIYRVCKDLGLDVAVKSYYDHGDYTHKQDWGEAHYIGSDFIEDSEYVFEDTWEVYDLPGVKKIEEFRGEGSDKTKISDVPVMWVTEMSVPNEVRTAYPAYGNEPSLGYAYGDVCIVAQRRK